LYNSFVNNVQLIFKYSSKITRYWKPL